MSKKVKRRDPTATQWAARKGKTGEVPAEEPRTLPARKWYVAAATYHGPDEIGSDYDPVRQWTLTWVVNGNAHNRRCTYECARHYVTSSTLRKCQGLTGVKSRGAGARNTTPPTLGELGALVASHRHSGGTYPDPSACGVEVVHQHRRIMCAVLRKPCGN